MNFFLVRDVRGESIGELMKFFAILIGNTIVLGLLLATAAVLAFCIAAAYSVLVRPILGDMHLFVLLAPLMAAPFAMAYVFISSLVIVSSKTQLRNFVGAYIVGCMIGGLIIFEPVAAGREMFMMSALVLAIIAFPHYFIARKLFSTYFEPRKTQHSSVAGEQ